MLFLFYVLFQLLFRDKETLFFPVIMIFTANNVYFKFRYSFYVNIEISITCQTVWIFILFFWNRKKKYILFLFFCVKFILFSKFNFHKLNWKRRDLFILQCMIVNLEMKNLELYLRWIQNVTFYGIWIYNGNAFYLSYKGKKFHCYTCLKLSQILLASNKYCFIFSTKGHLHIYIFIHILVQNKTYT